LERWAEFGWVREEPSSPNEIGDLLAIVARALKDSKVEAISEDLRFQAAFSASLTAANIALRASGYRTRVQTGHHQKIIESMEFTLDADPKLIHKLRVFSKKRNATSYDAAGSISTQELQQAIAVAEEMHQTITFWLKRNHPNLMS
jgi:hypothetical protein